MPPKTKHSLYLALSHKCGAFNGGWTHYLFIIGNWDIHVHHYTAMSMALLLRQSNIEMWLLMKTSPFWIYAACVLINNNIFWYITDVWRLPLGVRVFWNGVGTNFAIIKSFVGSLPYVPTELVLLFEILKYLVFTKQLLL